jgi:hypothetical protein
MIARAKQKPADCSAGFSPDRAARLPLLLRGLVH